MKEKRVAQMSDDQMWQIIKKACDDYAGDCTVLESAIGALVWGRIVGWHGIRLMHSGRTFKRYEEILKVHFKEVLPARTKAATRMRGIRLADNVGRFWQAVTSGLVPAREAAIADTT